MEPQNEKTRPSAPMRLNAVVLDCPDPSALARFYAELLGWFLGPEDGDDDFVGIAASADGSGLRILFQRNEIFVPPVWPETPGAQQQMAHLDFAVASKAEMEEAAERAVRLGARRAPEQFSEFWTVMLDPVGHPFCFVVW